MTPNDPWFTCLPPCEAYLPCGTGRHVVRWEAGELILPGHPDTEAELVLAALGGDKARCVAVAEAWGRHVRDLTVLGIGPRGPADEIVVSWDDVDAAAQDGQRQGQARPRRIAMPMAMGLASPPAPAVQAQAMARAQEAKERMRQAAQRRNDLLSWLALGYGFQVRLIGQVADAHGDLPEDERAAAAPSLVQAITGRLAPAVEAWLGLDPAQVVVTLHQGPGWGSAELTGQGDQRRLRVSLPARWLARVWAAGLALAGRHLVVAVDEGGWPDARVLALRAPGTEPVLLGVHARGGVPGARDAPHWET
jgi:hypothetical protein